MAILLAIASVVVVQETPGQDAKKDFLKYSLSVKPGDIQINRMPPVPQTRYKETFVFTATNPTRTDFVSEAPTSQLHEIIVFRTSGATRQEVWRWSKGKVFTQVLTRVRIDPGKTWQSASDWEFGARDAADGDYVAVAIFIPSGGTSEVKFKITSVQ